MFVYMVERDGLYYKHGRWVEKDKGQVWSEYDIPENLASHHSATLEVLESKTVESKVFGAGYE
jgi:hypothetical protein